MRKKINKFNCVAVILAITICTYHFDASSKKLNNVPQTIEKAIDGDSASQTDLVDYYYNSTDNYIEVIKWCNILIANPKSEDHQKEYANRILGYCAYEGKGFDKSIDDAVAYWKRGTAYQGGFSALALAKVYNKELKDSVESIRWYRQAAEWKNKTAAYFLAQLYENGYEEKSDGGKAYYPNVSKNVADAAKFYDIYIERMGYGWSGVPVNSKLLYKLAQWYYTGESNLPKDYTRAFGLYNSAIESNSDSDEKNRISTEEEGNALWCISVCYRFGRGVEKDELTARRYVKRAAEKGNLNAISLMEE